MGAELQGVGGQQSTIVPMLVGSWAANAGTPRTNVTITKVSPPPSAMRPPTITSAVATRRGAVYLEPVDGGGEQRGEQHGDRTRHDDRRQVRHDGADARLRAGPEVRSG